MINKQRRLFIALCFMLGGLGFLLSLWPLEALSIALGAVGGEYIFALFLGILLDVAYGVPPGLLHFLFFPFTLLAALGIVIRIVVKRYFLQKSPQEKI